MKASIIFAIAIILTALSLYASISMFVYYVDEAGILTSMQCLVAGLATVAAIGTSMSLWIFLAVKIIDLIS
jgi:hypothetical protein